MHVNVPPSMSPDPRSQIDQVKWIKATDARTAEMTVGDIAALVGISVRTLHHWDEIQLVCPSGRTSAGYRTYSAVDVARIHRVLIYRELGLNLAKIAVLLDDVEVDETAHLTAQRDLLNDRITQMQGMVEAVNEMLAATSNGGSLSAKRQSEIFGKDWQPELAEEAEQRWGASAQWAQFEETASRLSSRDRDSLRLAGEQLFGELGMAKRAGVRPESEQGRALAERHRTMVGQLYDCTHSRHVLLGRLFIEDQRFSSNIDSFEPGLSHWLHDAINANARVYGVDPEAATWD